jgi:hypothetical protein
MGEGVDKILCLTSLMVSDYLCEHFSECLMHILTNKSGNIFIKSKNIFLGGLGRHLLQDFKQVPSYGHNGARNLFPMYTQFD